MFEQFTKEELNCCGIYMIRNTVNNKCYIGSADVSFKVRWKRHLSDLKRKDHHSPYLQNAWYKYGADNFKFYILEFTVKSKSNKYILSREQWYLDFYLPVYNICKIAGSRKGCKNAVETRAKISVALSCITGELHPKSKWYKAISPSGIGYIFKGMSKFCREHNLDQSHMIQIAQGKRKHHKKWVCECYEPEQVAA